MNNLNQSVDLSTTAIRLPNLVGATRSNAGSPRLLANNHSLDKFESPSKSRQFMPEGSPSEHSIGIMSGRSRLHKGSAFTVRNEAR